MKAIIFALCLVAVCSAQFFYPSKFLGTVKYNDPKDAKASLGEIFNGFWEYANLTDPTQAIECFDEPTANLTLIFIGDMLKQVAQQQVTLIPKTISDFQSQFPPSTAQCLAKDPEVADLAVAFNITDVPFTVLEAQITKYILLHIKTLHSQASTGYFYYFQGMYNALGNLFGVVFDAMIANKTNTHTVASDALSNLQDLYDGLFEQANLSDPTSLVQCYNETSAQITLDFFGDVIGDLASDKYLALVREFQIYRHSLSPELLDCIHNSAEFSSVYNAYGFNSVTGKELLQKYVTFNVQHHFMLLNETKTIDQKIDAGDYKTAGQVTGQLIQDIMGMDKSSADMGMVKMIWELIKRELRGFMNKF